MDYGQLGSSGLKVSTLRKKLSPIRPPGLEAAGYLEAVLHFGGNVQVGSGRSDRG
jgi:hypothetical protein